MQSLLGTHVQLLNVDSWTFPLYSANIGNARVLGLATALNLSSNQYNLAVSIFFVGYVVFETPSNIIIKRTSPRWYIPIMTVSALVKRLCCGADNVSAEMSRSSGA